jgi:hypothetical protein
LPSFFFLSLAYPHRSAGGLLFPRLFITEALISSGTARFVPHVNRPLDIILTTLSACAQPIQPDASRVCVPLFARPSERFLCAPILIEFEFQRNKLPVLTRRWSFCHRACLPPRADLICRRTPLCVMTPSACFCFLLSSVCSRYIHFCFFTARAVASLRCGGGVRDVYYSPRVSASLSFPVYKRDKCGGQHRELNVSGRAGYCSRYWIPISSRPTRRVLNFHHPHMMWRKKHEKCHPRKSWDESRCNQQIEVKLSKHHSIPAIPFTQVFCQRVMTKILNLIQNQKRVTSVLDI